MKVMTEKQLAEELGLSVWTIRKMRIQKGLPYFGTAGRILYRMESVLKWIENQENKDNTANEDQVKIRKID